MGDKAGVWQGNFGSDGAKNLGNTGALHGYESQGRLSRPVANALPSTMGLVSGTFETGKKQEGLHRLGVGSSDNNRKAKIPG